MSFTTGNPERDSLIKRAIAECIACHEEATYGNVTEKLEHLAGFDLGEDELRGMIGELKAAGGGELPTIEGAPATPQVIRARKALPPNSLKKIEPPRAAQPETPHEDTAKATPGPKITQAESQRRVEAAHAALGEARVNVRIAQEHIAQTKATLATRITEWQTAADPVSPELRRQREARAMIATSNQSRANRYNRTAITAKQFVQKRMQNGPNRGAYSQQQAARVGFRVPGSERHG